MKYNWEYLFSVIIQEIQFLKTIPISQMWKHMVLFFSSNSGSFP